MRRRHHEIKGFHADVVAISFEPLERLMTEARDLGLPFPVLSDPHRKTYRDYGLSKGSLREVYNVKAGWGYLKLLLRGRRFRFVRSDLRQFGGDFVIDMEGSVRFAYKCRGPQDAPSVEQLISVLKDL